MLKYVNVGIVFQEIPDEVTLAINISNCPCRCPGCHSSYLWNDVGIPLTTDVLDEFVGKFGTDITCICFMGGDAEPEYVSQLAGYLHQAHPNYRVGGTVVDCVLRLRHASGCLIISKWGLTLRISVR